ncbi:MAG: acetyl-CoA carboxylase biotin carboxyl carrier protein subunit [Phycisphaerales bacterium]|nr:acetyl-CoA carboxylase biotin carboxyl carrier protein subunit [Phycisphaerales bacterium]MCB9856347.1 acetyl-CoA carboxylase biotin carboxyl carrier protein subunit [Phycisphaerales bacterium]MCB9864019.1 acetyl-CoA carboxylase biotin carboxyl carrier protein subunit [Phycisphaerales bacterium]
MKVELKHPSSDSTQTVVLERTADDIAACEAMFGDRLVPVEVERADESSGWLRLAGRVHRYHVLRRDNALHVWIDGKNYRFERIHSTARRAGAAGAGKASNQLTAPMPGTILKINGKPGDRFEPHAPIIIMESMKMEMSLTAPSAVVLKSVDCKVGQLVDMGRVLAQVEPVAHAE